MVLTIILSLFLLVIFSILLGTIIDALIPFDSVKNAFFFPGTVVHEAAHAGVSKLLGVPVLEINFRAGYVRIDPDINPLKRFIIGISPLFFCWLVGGSLFLAAISLLNSGSWAFGVLLVMFGLSIYVAAAPSLPDLTNLLHNDQEAVTGAVWVFFCGLIGFFLLLEQPFGAVNSVHLALVGGIVTAALGYLIWRVRSEDEGKWIL